MPFTEKELEEYLITHFTDAPATDHIDKYVQHTGIDVADKNVFDYFKDLEPSDTDITFTYLDNDTLSNNIEYQRDYLKSYQMHLCLYQVDSTLRLPFLKYLFVFENNVAKFKSKALSMQPFIDINENRHAISPTEDEEPDEDDETSEVDQEFIRQISEFAKEVIGEDTDITNLYKGFLEDENDNLYIFLEIENLRLLKDKNQYKTAILDEILNTNTILNHPIDKHIISLFQKHEFIQNLRTKENMRVQFPKITYICNQNDNDLVQNMFVENETQTELLIYPTIKYNEYGNIYTFSAIPITIENLENIRRYACFIENQDYENVNDSGNVAFQENDIQFYGVYEDDIFTELD